MKLPMTPRALVAIAGGVAAVAFATWWGWPRDQRAKPGGAGGSSVRLDGGRRGGGGTGGGGGVAVADAGTAAGPITEVTRLSPEQRRTLGAQIAAARERARQRALAAAEAEAGVDPADVVIPLERVQGDLKQALEDSVKILADCYENQPGGPGARDAAVLLRMTSDPDFGTVIDTDEITDGQGTKLPSALDECLRDSIDTLALPPLGEGGKLDLQYTFRFDEDEDAR